MTPGDHDSRFSRRALFAGAGAVAVGAAGVIAGRAWTDGDPGEVTTIAATGMHQAGIARPQTPQRTCLVMVADVDPGAIRASLATLGDRVRALASGTEPTVPASGDLSVTVGVGPRVLSASGHPGISHLLTLPTFAGDEALRADRRGGDLYISLNADDPTVLEPAAAVVTETIAGWRLRWSDLGFRGTPDGDIVRNPFGYHDGVVIPRGTEELDREVWISDGPFAGGTICVIRRFRLATDRFRALSTTRRDQIIGREQGTGAPLSGGVLHDEVNLTAKSADGTFLTPAHSHVRAAHPSFTGSGLMLRRSYGYRTSADDHGHLFISFQKDIGTFTRTQLRMDDMDELMTFSTPTATAAFLILPGFTADRPLGSML
ncbi:Dyp-type peroxidase [Microbacterium koreense]|uniref:Dyp-type peroxidase n=1 Tax=Microbacterium koreense TaxID=323761 RepID=A0ABW2ZM68_9MICO